MVEKKARKKRNRATALVMNGGRLLLVRERGAKRWSLPGGGMKKGEAPVTAACRELDEETKLVATSATYLFHYESPSQRHHVCLLETEGKVELLREEIGDYRWWDGETEMAIIPSAVEIIERVKLEGFVEFAEAQLFPSA
ncbi:MAG: NUDIX domain-containing protein [Chloroflexota bacterium]|nr:NUDIX domain-containing protein [Chloroflexota bacterium]